MRLNEHIVSFLNCAFAYGGVNYGDEKNKILILPVCVTGTGIGYPLFNDIFIE